MAEPILVAGYCPMGCGETLFLGQGGYVTCSFRFCPDPAFVGRLLADRETEHIAKFDDASFTTVQHPLRERGSDLFECSIHHDLSSLPGRPVKPGRYRVTRILGALRYERLDG